MSAARGLHAGEIDCLLSRVLGNDLQRYLGAATPTTLRIRLRGVRWLGVFARDQLPKDLQQQTRPWALVLNTDPSNKPGQHWLALFGPRDGGRIELFDSFGLEPKKYKLDSLAPLHTRIQFQFASSAVCGHYCIYFLYHRSHASSSFTEHLCSFDSIVECLRKAIDPDNWVERNVHHLQLAYRTLNPCNRTGQCSKLKCSFC